MDNQEHNYAKHGSNVILASYRAYLLFHPASLHNRINSNIIVLVQFLSALLYETVRTI